MPEEASLVITNSGIPNAVPEPNFIAFGELTLNWADGVLYFKDSEGVIQSISRKGIEPIILSARLPVNEGPWDVFEIPEDPVNTAYRLVQRGDGNLPRLKIGLISNDFTNFVQIDNDTDITVGVVEGTTMNQVIGLIRSNSSANSLVRIFNSPNSDGTGVITDGLPLLENASFTQANINAGDRAEVVGQTLFVEHTSVITGNDSISEWTAGTINPTIWVPRTSGIIYNRDSSMWEVLISENGTLQTIALPDQN